MARPRRARASRCRWQRNVRWRCAPRRSSSGKRLNRLSSRKSRSCFGKQGAACASAWTPALSRGGYPYRIAAESNSTLALLELARAGLGFAIVPRPLAEKYTTDGQLKLVQIQNPPITRRYALVYHTGKTLTPAMRTVIHACKGLSANDTSK